MKKTKLTFPGKINWTLIIVIKQTIPETIPIDSGLLNKN